MHRRSVGRGGVSVRVYLSQARGTEARKADGWAGMVGLRNGMGVLAQSLGSCSAPGGSGVAEVHRLAVKGTNAACASRRQQWGSSGAKRFLQGGTPTDTGVSVDGGANLKVAACGEEDCVACTRPCSCAPLSWRPSARLSASLNKWRADGGLPPHICGWGSRCCSSRATGGIPRVASRTERNRTYHWQPGA